MNLPEANTRAKRMVVSDFHTYKPFYTHKDIVFKQDDKSYLHTFNYLFQDIADKPYLTLNDTCISYNELVFNSETFDFDTALDHLKTMGFDQYIEQKT